MGIMVSEVYEALVEAGASLVATLTQELSRTSPARLTFPRRTNSLAESVRLLLKSPELRDVVVPDVKLSFTDISTVLTL